MNLTYKLNAKALNEAHGPAVVCQKPLSACARAESEVPWLPIQWVCSFLKYKKAKILQGQLGSLEPWKVL